MQQALSGFVSRWETAALAARLSALTTRKVCMRVSLPHKGRPALLLRILGDTAAACGGLGVGVK